MKTIFCIFSMVSAVWVALGAGESSSRADINPALLYNQAFLVAPELLSTADDAYLLSKEGLSDRLPDRFGKIVAGYDNEFKLVRQAALSTVPCDWGIDMSQGPAALLPHLGRSKAVAVAARLRVRWDLEHDRQQDARDDLLATFAMARNVSRDGTLISVLVQIAMEAIACNIVAENFGQFSPDTLKELADGFDAAPPRATIASSVLMEKVFFHDWLLARILELQKRYPSDDAKVMAGIDDLFSSMGASEPGQPNAVSNGLRDQLTRAGARTSEEVLKLLREEGELYEKVSAIAALPEPQFESQMQQFNLVLRKSTNPFVSLAFPAVEKAKRRELRIDVTLAMLRAAVEYKLHGDAGFQSVTDPAGAGPFDFQRFLFEGVDRGFQLKSVYRGSGYPEVLIFVEQLGTPFMIDGPHAGEPRQPVSRAK